MPLPRTSLPDDEARARIDRLFRRPGFLLRRAHQLSVGLFEQYCAQLRLTPPQFGVLYVVDAVGPLDQTTLSRALGFDKVTTLRIVRGLESRGMLGRTVNGQDARKLLLELTPEGRDVLAQAELLSAASSEHILSPLAPSERKTLLGLLQKLCDGLEGDARTPLVKPVAKAAGKRPRART